MGRVKTERNACQREAPGNGSPETEGNACSRRCSVLPAEFESVLRNELENAQKNILIGNRRGLLKINASIHGGKIGVGKP